MRPTALSPVSAREVSARIEVGDADLVSHIILSVSPCRSGTTVLLRVFGAAGVLAFFQPLKNVLRWWLQGKQVRWQVPRRAGERVYVKETLGPYTEAEAGFDPLAALLGAGFPPEKLHVLIVGREPFSTWASWEAWWKGKTTTRIFALSYETTDGVRVAARQMGIPVTVMVYEALRDHPPEEVVRRLFARLGVSYSSLAVAGWESLPPMGESGSNVVWPEEPPPFVTPGIHEPVERSTRLTYHSRPSGVADLEPACREEIKAFGVPQVYERWRVACERDLGLRVRGLEE